MSPGAGPGEEELPAVLPRDDVIRVLRELREEHGRTRHVAHGVVLEFTGPDEASGTVTASSEIEEVISTHPAVAEVGVAGLPDHMRGATADLRSSLVG